MAASLSSLDDLFVLAEATPFLEKLTETIQRHENYSTPLSRDWLMQPHITKLLQDVGVQIEREFNGYDPNAPTPGDDTRRVNEEYKPVDQKRVHGVMKNIYTALDQSLIKEEEKRGLRNSLKEIMGNLQLPLAPRASHPAKAKQLRP